MPNVVTCACQMRLDVSQRVAGQVVTCPACGQPHTIQAPRPVIFDDLPPHVPPAKTGSRQGQQITPHTPPESPFRLALFSFLLVGLGQMMLGQTQKGLTLMAVCILTCGSGFLLAWPFAIVDAYLVGKKLAEGRSVGEWECF